MKMIPVESSQIAAVGYDAPASNLRILFRRGELYQYGNVPAEVHTRLVESPSIGIAFGKFIKGNPNYPFSKIGYTAESSGAPASGERERHVVLDASEAQECDAPPEVQKVSEQSNEIAAQARAAKVVDVASQRRASALLLDVARMRGHVAATFRPMKDAAHKAHKVICEQEKTLDMPLLEAETFLKRQIGSFIEAERARAREEEERQRREERERAETEAKRESERLALEDALQLEAEGEHAAAEAALASPLPIAPRFVPPAPVAPQIASVAGVSSRTTYKWRVVDESKIPREYMMPNDTAIGSVVRGLQAKTNIPGIEVYPETTVAASRRST